MINKIPQNQGLALRRNLGWRLPVIIGVMTAGSVMMEHCVIVPGMPPEIHWVVRLGWIFGIILVTGWLTNRWMNRVNTSCESVDQRSADLLSAPFSALFYSTKVCRLNKLENKHG